MAFKVLVKPIVFLDAEDAVSYYEKKSKGLGKRFYKSFLNSLNEISAKPFVYSFVKEPVRRHLIKKFPYKIFYIVNGKTIIVIGVSHAKRSSAFIRKRIE
jgi:hypothetical protein